MGDTMREDRYPWAAFLAALTAFVVSMLWVAQAAEFECSTRKAQTFGRFDYPIEDCTHIEWDRSPGATYYEVWRRLHGPFLGTWSEWELVDTVNITESSLADHPAYPMHRRFQLRVKACDDVLPNHCSELTQKKIWARRIGL